MIGISLGDGFLKRLSHTNGVAVMKDDSKELKNLGLKVTTQRLRILDLFRSQENKHLSAEDIYKILLEENSEIGLATIYRALAQFSQAGLLERHQFESGRSVFEIKGGTHHDHLVCLDCGHVEEFYDEALERRQRAIAKDKGFLVREHSLYLFAECLNKQCCRRVVSEES